MSTEQAPESEPSALAVEPTTETPPLEVDEQLALEPAQGEVDQEPWVRYGIKRASRVDLKHPSIERQAELLADCLKQEDILVVTGRDCGAPIGEIASSAAFKYAEGLGTSDTNVFVVRLNEEIIEDDETQKPQGMDELEEAMRILPSVAFPKEGVARSILCVELSLDEPMGFARSILGQIEPVDRLKYLAEPGQQLIFVLELKAQEKVPSLAYTKKRGVILLDWVEPLLAYYNDRWDLDPNTISNAAQELKSAYQNRPEREAALYGIVYALKNNSFRGGAAEFEERIREAIGESQKTGETIKQLGNYFSSGNRIEQTILALAAFGPTMSNRTFSALGQLFLSDDKIPLAFLPDYARGAVEDVTEEKKRPTWTQAWKEHLDFYRNKLKIGQSRNQEVELRVNRDSLRDHLLENYPAGLQRIIEAIPNVLLQRGYERELEESAIRLLIRLAVTDQRSYDNAWFVKCLLGLCENPSNVHKSTFALSKVATALRVLDEQTSDQRDGFAAGIFDELVRTLRKRDFPIGSIVELCRRLDPNRFGTISVLALLLQNSSLEEFRAVLDNIGFAGTKITPPQRLRLMSLFAKNLLSAGEYRDGGAADHRAKRALWIWNAGLRADRFPPHVPYQKIILHRTFARELFLGGPESPKTLLEGTLKFDPRALAFAGRSRRDLRRWLENIAAVVIRATDADLNSIVSANSEALWSQISDCIIAPIFGARSHSVEAKIDAFNELEPLELWRDVYLQLDENKSNQAEAAVGERLLRLPLIARSSLIAEWFFQLKFATHSIGGVAGEQYKDAALNALRSIDADEQSARDLAEDFDYLAGVTSSLVFWSEANLADRRLAQMYVAKRELLEGLIAGLRG